MHVILSGVHIEVTEAIRNYTLEKMQPLEKLIPQDDTSAKLTIEFSKVTNHHVNGQVFQAEAMLHMRGKDRALKTTQDDLYKAIDLLKDMLVREMSQHKDKERSVIRRGAQKVKALFKMIS